MDHMKTATVRELRNEFPRMPGPLEVTTLLLYEFRQAVRFQIRLHRQDAAKGYPRGEGTKMMADLKADLVLFLLGKLDLNSTLLSSPWRRLPACAASGLPAR